jgi:hypothetical protein
MEFNPFSHHVIRFILNFCGRSVAVFQSDCGRHGVSCPCHPCVPLSTCVIAPLVQDVLAVIQRSFRSLQGVPANDIVLLAVVPGFEKHGQVEFSKEVWPMLRAQMGTVTIALESGAYPIGSWRRVRRQTLTGECFLFDSSIQKLRPELRTRAACQFCLLMESIQ